MQLAKVGEYEKLKSIDFSDKPPKISSSGLKSIISSILPRKEEGEKELDKILVDKLSYAYEFYDNLKEDGFDNIAYF